MSRAPHKGHAEALAAFFKAVLGVPETLPLEEVFKVSRWSIAKQAMR